MERMTTDLALGLLFLGRNQLWYAEDIYVLL